MRSRLYQLIFITALLLSSFFSYSQKAINVDSLNLDGDLQAWYDAQVGPESTSLIIGTRAIPEVKAVVSHPFFRTNIWVDGSMSYRDETFGEIPLMYDLEKDLLYLKVQNSDQAISHPVLLIQNQVEWFRLKDAVFKYVPNSVDLLGEGFFQFLHDGEQIKLIAKRRKYVLVGGSKGESEYRNQNWYFIDYNGYHRIKRKSDLLKLFPEYKKQIRLYARKNHLKIARPDHDEDFVQVVNYCESLIAQ